MDTLTPSPPIPCWYDEPEPGSIEAFWHGELSLIDLPHIQQTRAIAEFAIRRYGGEELEFIDRDLRTPDLCEQAVAKHPKAIRFVPREHLTEALCLTAVSHPRNREQTFLRQIPREHRTDAERSTRPCSD